MYERRKSEIVTIHKIVLLLCASVLLADAPAYSADAPVKHVIVYKEAGRFCGWPANYGTWSWGNEILVGFRFSYGTGNN